MRYLACLALSLTTILLLTSSIEGQRIKIKEENKRTLRQNQEFTIELPAQTSTGCTWLMLTGPVDQRWVELIKKECTAAKRIGGPNTEKLTFKALRSTGPTSYEFCLYYCRPWLGDVKEIIRVPFSISK